MTTQTTTSRGWLTTLNTRHHRTALNVYLALVVAHWAEHILQAIQIYALGWPLKEARGALGVPFPWLVTSEWMHYGYALLMLVGLILLRPGFVGRSRVWWNISLGIQVWHHLEHLLLLIQALAGANLLGRPVPTSIIQLVVPRVELHLFYNALVFAPMVVAMVLHRRARQDERARMRCTCALSPA
ncbi:hypothetical protein GCM10022252_45200 [Streptosporangium oxazolinicum]|uniref:Uncharacterized protein n=1 Tax=Streptosporangium oxazolinicum TaxID=909287 RepID=A0ABP8B365_9ACTN